MRVGMAFGAGAFQTGVERYARRIIPAVQRQGIDAVEVKLARREVKLFGRPVGGMLTLWWDRATFPRGDWDLLHALDPAVATRRTDVVTVHDILIETHPGLIAATRAERLDWAVTRSLAKRARWFLCMSAFTRDAVVKHWGVSPERCVVAYSGIDPDFFRPEPSPTPLLAPGKLNLAYVGDDHPRKNLLLTLQAMRELRERHGVESRFVRFGPTRFPAMRERAHAYAREHGLDLVEPGFVDDVTLRAVLSGCDAFVWPSLAEGFGLPPIEAMACGAKVAALDIDVTREVCGDRALYHSNDPVDAAACYAKLRDTPWSRERQREWALRYSWEANARKVVGVYEKALAEGRR